MKILIVLAFAAFVYCDLKSDLIKRAEELEKTASDAIKKLESENKTALASGLQHEEQRIKELAKELQSETGPEAIILLENELHLVELRLGNELRALEREAKTKEDLLAIAVKLEADIKTEVQKLRAEGNSLVAASLEREGQWLETISTELKTAVGTLRTAAIEANLRLVEVRVNEELRRLGFRSGTTANTAQTGNTNPTATRLTTPPPTIILY